MVIDAQGVLVLSASKADNVSGTQMKVLAWTLSLTLDIRTPRLSPNDIPSPTSTLPTYRIKTDRNYQTVSSSTSRMEVLYSAPVSISRAKLEF